MWRPFDIGPTLTFLLGLKHGCHSHRNLESGDPPINVLRMPPVLLPVELLLPGTPRFPLAAAS